MSLELNEIKKKVCEIAKHAYYRQLSAGTSGNVSARYEELIAITPSGYSYELMTPNDIVVIDFNGKIIEGALTPSSEWRMHLELYKGLPHIGAVVHTHSPYATSFAVVRKEIPLILIEMEPTIKGSLEVSPYSIQGSPEVGTNAIPILKNKNACLLANHGVLAVGENADHAYINAIYTEDIAKIYHLSLAVGQPVVIA